MNDILEVIFDLLSSIPTMDLISELCFTFFLKSTIYNAGRDGSPR